MPPRMSLPTREPPTQPIALPRFEHDTPRPVQSAPLQSGSTLDRLVGLMRRLLGPAGCPWDQKQTHASLRKYVLEEACEVIDAIDGGNMGELRDELGDLLLQVVFHAELARASGDFAIDDVVEAVVSKLVRRHPHVFGDAVAETPEAVLQNWESIKAREHGNRGVLGGVPRALPALVRAQRVGEKVHSVGFDWPDAQASYVKVGEELGELAEAVECKDISAQEEELGDVLFALVNYARHLGLDAESALRKTTDKFTRRFDHVEKRVREVHGGFGEGALALETLDAYWDEAKVAERATKRA